MARKIIECTVYGSAVPQGSMSSFKAGVVTHSKRERLMEWRRNIRDELSKIAPQYKNALVKHATAVRATFYEKRKPSISKRAVYKRTAPDLDKLQRAVGDALESYVLLNDSTIVHWHTWKLYTEGASRLDIEVWELEQKDLPPIQTGTPQFAFSFE